MRRVASRIAPSAAVAMMARRYYAPAEDLKKLYESDFDKAAFPVSVIPSDSTLFAQFLYKAAEPKNAFDAVLKDFDAVGAAAKKLPVFWERTADVEKEFKGVSPAMTFTMKWMQANGMLNSLPAVQDTFKTYVNAQKKRVVAKIYLPGPEKDHANEVKAAKEAAKKLHADNADTAKFALDFTTHVDADFKSGWAVEVVGMYHSAAKGAEVAAAAGARTDYTNIPAEKVSKTAWEDGVESDVLRKYLNNLAQQDMEEQTKGV